MRSRPETLDEAAMLRFIRPPSRRTGPATDMSVTSPRAGIFTRMVRGGRGPATALAEAPLHDTGAGTAPEPPAIARDRAPERRRARTFVGWLPVSFGLCVVLPLVCAWAYLAFAAQPQFASHGAFTVRSGAADSPADALSGLARAAGAAQAVEVAILAEYLESRTLLGRLEPRLDTLRHYSAPHARDPVFALAPDATMEDRLRHWRRVVRVTQDPATGIVEVAIRAFSPEMAQLLLREVLREGQAMLDEIDAASRSTAMARTQAELVRAGTALREARADLTAFRAETRILAPALDFENRMGILRRLQEDLADALVVHDLQGADADTDAAQRIAILRDRIAAERAGLVVDGASEDADYPSLLATQERLAADRDFAETAYRQAVVARDLALAADTRDGRFIAVFEEPSLAERSDHPDAASILGLGALLLTALWSVGVLAAAAIADRR